MNVTKREAAHGLDRVTRFQGENANMNSPILPVGGPSGPPTTGSATTVAGDVDDLLTDTSAGGRVLSISAARMGPPQEVLEQIAVASAIERRMRAHGRRVRFLPAGSDGRIRVEIHDRCGGVRCLTLTEAFELAAGGRLG